MKQLSLIEKSKPYFGGQLTVGIRKSARPLSRKHAMHLVLKAKIPVFFKNKTVILPLIRRYAEKFGLKIYNISVQKNHIHLSIRVFRRENYIGFIRALTGQLAKKIGRGRRGFWECRPFSRIVSWGRGFRTLKEYIEMNEREVLGLQVYTPRKNRYRGELVPP